MFLEQYFVLFQTRSEIFQSPMKTANVCLNLDPSIWIDSYSLFFEVYVFGTMIYIEIIEFKL